MSIDFEVDYSSEMAEKAQADWNIHYLAHIPE